MTADQKHYFWKQHIEAWRESQLSQRVYCDQNKLSFSSFGYWRKRLQTNKNAEKKLIPVTVMRSLPSINIYLPTGMRLECPIEALEQILPLVYRSTQGQ